MTSIKRKIEKFSNICKTSCDEEDDSLAKKMEIKRSVAERSPSQTAVSPSVLPQVKRPRHLQAEHTRVKASLFQSRPILPKPDNSGDRSQVNTEVIYFILRQSRVIFSSYLGSLLYEENNGWLIRSYFQMR